MSTKIDFNALCRDYDFGQLLSPPAPLVGGRSHELWKIDTEKGAVVVKRLLSKIEPQINLDLYRNTQAIAMLIRKARLPVLPALMHGTDVIYQQSECYMMVFPFVPHNRLKPLQITSTHCQHVGDFLARLHSLKLDVPCADAWHYDYEQKQWQDLVEQLQQSESVTAPLLKKLLPQIDDCFRNKCDSDITDLVISHRDLDTMNLLWLDDTSLVVIDWDSCGRIGAAVELLFVALAWSMNAADDLDFDKFDAIVKAYRARRELKMASSESVLYLVMQNWLTWAHKQIDLQLSLTSSLAEKVMAANDARNSLQSFEYIMSHRDNILEHFMS